VGQLENSLQMVRGLNGPESFPHGVKDVRVLETHISWVVLTGDYAYKIKKPVDLGFLNFTSLAGRKYFCEEELRLNRRFAPEIYLEVVPIGHVDGRWVVGTEPAIDWAVRMRQFPDKARLDQALADGRLDAADLGTAAEAIAAFHEAQPPARRRDPDNEPVRVRRPMDENFEQLRPNISDPPRVALLQRLEDWMNRELEKSRGAFAARAAAGRVRECHGDLHLANLVRWQGRITPFDCIEFDPELRIIDVINDSAFLVMDLMARDREDLAFSFLNRYLECTGDYAGLAVLRIYLVYRSLVRAKVSALQHTTGDLDLYLDLANALIATAGTPRLMLMHGFSGSGKTWLSDRLLQVAPAIRLRSDLERKRMAGLEPTARTGSGVASGLYATAKRTDTYDRLAQLTETGLRSGFDMLVDATFLARDQRRMFIDLAKGTGARVFILDCDVPTDVLRARLRERNGRGGDASEANVDVLDYQLAHHDPLTAAEQAMAVPLTANCLETAAQRIRGS